MPEKTKKTKKNIKVRDLKPRKDAKGGDSTHHRDLGSTQQTGGGGFTRSGAAR